MPFAEYFRFLYLNRSKILKFIYELEAYNEDYLYYVEEAMQDSQSLVEQIEDLVYEFRHNTIYIEMAYYFLEQISDVYETYTNDKKWLFENKTLGNIATLDKIPPFTYEKIIVNSVNYADVIWFNERLFPSAIFEVEHSTDFRDAFIKFMELQDFTTHFYCVADEMRFSKFEKERLKTAFKSIKERVKFLSYESVQKNYQISCEINKIKNARLDF